MVKILIVKSAFCPNKEHYEKTIVSLVKLNIYLEINKNNIEYDLLIMGWVGDFIPQLELFLKVYKMIFKSIDVDLFPINYGKYYLLNKLIESHFDYDKLIYLDHDIYLDHTNKIKLIDLLEIDHIIVFNQKEDIRHQNTIYENNIKINNLDFCWPNTISAMASGGFIIPVYVLQTLDTLPLLNVYGLDDYYFFTEIKSKNYNIYVIIDFFIIHPIDTDDKYISWKKNEIIKLLNNTDVDYYASIEESHNFWK